MLDKDKRRGERRDRSKKKFLKRLRQDQLEHGRKADPWEFGKDGTTLCECFYDPKAQSRFKDTPKQKACACCKNKRTEEGESIQEIRSESVERENFGNKNPNVRSYPRKISCTTCGIFMKWSEDGKHHWDRCKKCKEKK